MNEFLDKISSYNIFTNLLPGVVFCFLADNSFGYSLIQDDVIVGMFLYYFVGLVISRIGSIVVEPLLIRCRIIKYAAYKDYVVVSRSDPKISQLLETNNMYRSGTALAACLLVVSIFVQLANYFQWSTTISSIVAFAVLFVLFLASFSKQTSYIRQRVQIHKDNKQSPDNGTQS